MFIQNHFLININRELSFFKKQVSCFLMNDSLNIISVQISKIQKIMRHSVHFYQIIINFCYCDDVLKL